MITFMILPFWFIRAYVRLKNQIYADASELGKYGLLM